MTYNGAHTSTSDVFRSLRTQWYKNFWGSVQFCRFANASQFFIFFLSSTPALVVGQERTSSTVVFDHEQYLLPFTFINIKIYVTDGETSTITVKTLV